MVIELFELKFIDSSILWGNISNGVITYGTFGGCTSIANIYREFMDKIDKSKVCAFAYKLSNESKFVLSYRDIVDEKSNEFQKQILKSS